MPSEDNMDLISPSLGIFSAMCPLNNDLEICRTEVLVYMVPTVTNSLEPEGGCVTSCIGREVVDIPRSEDPTKECCKSEGEKCKIIECPGPPPLMSGATGTSGVLGTLGGKATSGPIAADLANRSQCENKPVVHIDIKSATSRNTLQPLGQKFDRPTDQHALATPTEVEAPPRPTRSKIMSVFQTPPQHSLQPVRKILKPGEREREESRETK